MKDDMTSSVFSRDYEQLHIASLAGEEQRKNSSDNRRTGEGGLQRRTYSCRYPSSSVVVSGQLQRQSVRRRDSARVEPKLMLKLIPSDCADDSCRRRRGSVQTVPSCSAPHSRSSSCKNRLRRRRPRDLRQFRETYSDPPSYATDGAHSCSNLSLEQSINYKLQQLKLLQDEDCCVVRCFDSTPKGAVINRGDSFKRKHESLVVDSLFQLDLDPHRSSRSRSHSTCNSCHAAAVDDDSLPAQVDQVCSAPAATSSCSVLVMGHDGVGRTALLQQFMTSEFMAAETTLGTECEKTVSVLLDGEETTLTFVDLPLSVQKDCIQYTEIEAYLVVYSLTDRQSFRYACDILRQLRSHGRTDAAVVLVANKSDLVRGRQVSDQEGRAICEAMHCKYMQVSAALNHRVDDLLVGLVRQTRLNPIRQNLVDRLLPATRRRSLFAVSQQQQSDVVTLTGCFSAAKEFFVELLSRKRTHEFDCDNLWTV